MPTFEEFASPDNLRQAYEHIAYENLTTDLSINPSLEPTLMSIKTLGDQFFDELSKIIIAGNYQPDKSGVVYATKGNLGLRPISMLSVIDRIIYQAILNPGGIGQKIDQQMFSFSFGNRLASKDSNTYLKSYKPKWVKFWDAQVAAFKAGFKWHIEFDIHTYFESILVEKLIKDLKREIGIEDQRILSLLENQLNTWSLEPHKGIGIPQGPLASCVLGNAYLWTIDQWINDNFPSSVKYWRYADDMVIMAKDKKELSLCLNQVTMRMREKNLHLNDKTSIGQLKSAAKLKERKFYMEYGCFVNVPSHQKVKEIEERLPEHISALKNGQISKKASGEIKYYLKSCNELHGRDFPLQIIEVADLIPSTIPLICQVVENIVHDPFLFEDDQKELEARVRERYWTKLLELYYDESFNEFEKCWLLKILARISYSDEEATNIIKEEFRKILEQKDSGLLKLVAGFYLCQRDKENTPIIVDQVRKFIRQASTPAEEAGYYYMLNFCSTRESKAIEEMRENGKKSNSLEVQTVSNALKGDELEEPIKLEQFFGLASRKAKKRPESYLPKKDHPTGSDIIVGADYILTVRGEVFSSATGDRIGKLKKATYYLVKRLKEGGIKHTIGKGDFKPLNDKAPYKWEYIRQLKTKLNKLCGKVIGTRTDGKYFYSYAEGQRDPTCDLVTEGRPSKQ